jgi:hypothetical protein
LDFGQPQREEERLARRASCFFCRVNASAKPVRAAISTTISGMSTFLSENGQTQSEYWQNYRKKETNYACEI